MSPESSEPIYMSEQVSGCLSSVCTHVHIQVCMSGQVIRCLLSVEMQTWMSRQMPQCLNGLSRVGTSSKSKNVFLYVQIGVSMSGQMSA